MNRNSTADAWAGAAAEHCLPVAHRVGMYGGAFDPPHRAHRELAEAALNQLGLDVLHILPTGQAWHKARALSPAEHRLAMCELAFGDLPKARIDPRETQRAGATYTVDTLEALAEEYPGAELYVVMGSDQLLAFKHWVRWEEVLQMATLAVAQRPDLENPAVPHQPAVAADLSGVDIPFVPLSMPLHHISATTIRARSSSANGQGPELDRLVSNDVASYISAHSLYQDPT